MREVEVGQKYRRVGRWAMTVPSEDVCVVNGVNSNKVSYTYESGRSDSTSKGSFYSSDQVYEASGEGLAGFVLIPEEDAVNHPSHYNSDPSGVECIEITRHRNFNIGAAFKYLWRAGLKEDASLDNLEKEIEDLEKAIFHIKDEIKRKRGE